MTKHLCFLDAFGGRALLKGLLAALILAAAAAVNTAAAGDSPKSDAKQTAEALISGAGFADGDVGYLVVDLADKRVLAMRNPDRPFIPASVAKIATIAPALEILGGDHRFTTTLAAAGNVANGVLTGSLILRGGGDPSLTGDDLQAMAKQLADSGIKRVNGSFLYDATAMIEMPQIDAMQPEAADYNSGISALSVNLNRVRLVWRTADAVRSGTAAAFSRKLNLPLEGIGIKFAGQALPGPYVRAASSDDNWLLSADLPAKGEEWLPVANPSRVTADLFRAAAAKAGVTLPAPIAGPTPEGARELARNDSAPLTEIARNVMRYSNNLTTELIGLAVSRNLTGQKLSLENSAAELCAWWKKQLPQANWSSLVLGNHSGLSSKSRATPRQLVAMLEQAASRPGGGEFHDLLHQVGWKGVKASAHVKTGTMEYVRGLAGYIDTVAGHRLAFALFFNDVDKRLALNASFDRRVVAIDSRSRAWRNRAIRVERTLTQGWAEKF